MFRFFVRQFSWGKRLSVRGESRVSWGLFTGLLLLDPPCDRPGNHPQATPGKTVGALSGLKKRRGKASRENSAEKLAQVAIIMMLLPLLMIITAGCTWQLLPPKSGGERAGNGGSTAPQNPPSHHTLDRPVECLKIHCTFKLKWKCNEMHIKTSWPGMSC